ncbi:MAG: hypothetical protein R3C05_15335 [Pirellulaceae bacterium]
MISIQLDREEGVYALATCWNVHGGSVAWVLTIFKALRRRCFGSPKGRETKTLPFTTSRERRANACGNLATAIDIPSSPSFPGPLTYDGQLLRIRWCVRLRVFLPNESDTVVQQPFFLGYADED